MTKSTERLDGKQQSSNNCNQAFNDAPKQSVATWVLSSPYDGCDGWSKVMALGLVTQNV